MSAHTFKFKTLNNQTIDLSSFKGKPFLICNTATLCGFNKQLHGLEALHRAGKQVLATPSNDFGQQEPGSSEALICTLKDKYQISFPVTACLSIKHNPHPFYQWLQTQVSFFGYPRWNFYKFIFDHEGNFIQWFSPLTQPNHPKIIHLLTQHH